MMEDKCLCFLERRSEIREEDTHDFGKLQKGFQSFLRRSSNTTLWRVPFRVLLARCKFSLLVPPTTLSMPLRWHLPCSLIYQHHFMCGWFLLGTLSDLVTSFQHLTLHTRDYRQGWRKRRLDSRRKHPRRNEHLGTGTASLHQLLRLDDENSPRSDAAQNHCI